MSKLAAAVVADFSKDFAALDFLCFLCLCLSALPWFADELESNEEDEKLDEHEGQHVDQCFGLHHGRGDNGHGQLE